MKKQKTKNHSPLTWSDSGRTITQRGDGAAFVVTGEGGFVVGLAGSLDSARRVARMDRQRERALSEKHNGPGTR